MSRRVLRSIPSTILALLISCSVAQAQQFCVTDTADTGEVNAFTKGAVQAGVNTISLKMDDQSDPIDSTSTPTGDQLKQGLEDAAAAWNTACPGGKTPDLALDVNSTRSMTGMDFISSFGVRYRLNEQTPVNVNGVTQYAVFHENTGVLEVYGQCVNKTSELNQAICKEVGQNLYIDWSHEWAVAYLEHEIGHGFGVGHDRGDGSCSDFGGVMSAPVNYREGSIKPNHCEMADFKSCDSTMGTCPKDPRLPDDPIGNLPGLCPRRPEHCVDDPGGPDMIAWWLLSRQTAEYRCTTYTSWACVGSKCSITYGEDCYWIALTTGSSPVETSSVETGEIVAPTMAIEAPAMGALVSGSVPVSGWAADADLGVTGVSLWVDDTPVDLQGFVYGESSSSGCSEVSTDPNCPYVGFSGDLDTAAFPDGSHILKAVASEDRPEYSGAGYVEIPITVDNTQPTASFTAPAAGATVSGDVAVTVSASDTYGMNLVSFYVDGVYQATDSSAPYSFTWSSGGWANGSHTLKIVAWDEAGNSRTVTRSVTASNDSETPQVTVTLPANGALVSGTVTFRAVASDNQGVSHVELYRDGALLKTDTSVPYQVGWNTTTVADGTYTLTARAYDAGGNVGVSAPITVTVDNTLPQRFVDVPSHQQSVGGTSVLLRGWAIDSSGVVSHSFALDGQPLAVTNLVTNLSRSSVCDTYPSVQDPACPYVGWRAYFDATQFSSGSHTLTLTVQDAAGNTRTFDRQFTIDNPALTASFYPVADATAWQAYPTYNDGTSQTIVVRTPANGEGAYAFLKFDVSGISGTVVSAELQVRTVTSMNELWLYWLTSNSWTEGGITWNWFPSPGGTLGSRFNLAGSTWYSYDVSSFVTGNGTYSMGFASSNASYAYVWSRESSYDPLLRVTYQP